MSSFSEIDNHPKFETFYEKHCVSLTYYFHVFKCDDLTYEFQKPIRGPVKVENFPDPVLYKEDSITRYPPGLDPAEKFLPSKLEDPEKRSHNIPFSTTAQTAKNVGITIRAKSAKSKKTRLLHSQKKMTAGEIKTLKRLISKFSCVCGSVISEYQGTGGEAKKEKEMIEKVFVREKEKE